MVIWASFFFAIFILHVSLFHSSIKAADAASDMELAGSSLMGNDQHWELLPAQVLCGRVFYCPALL